MMLGGTGMVRVLSPVTLSLEVHWEDVSELSVAVNQHRDKDTLILDQTSQPNINCRHLTHLYRLLFILKVALCRI